MFSMSKLERHVALMNRMSGALGTDLAVAVADGRLSPEALRLAMLRCTACDAPAACAAWLASRGGHAGGAAPAYCRNAALLAQIQAEDAA